VPEGPEEKRIEWRQFGVRLEAVPSIMSDRKLRLDVQTEFSERDFNSAVVVDGKEIPGLTTRRLNTQVELNAGEMLVLSNLRSTRSLTQADGNQQSETRELMILVTADVTQSAGSPDNPAPPPITN
jgi:pilus assembly protein CpaC